MQAGRRAGFIVVMLSLALAGCRHGERVENELRSRNAQLRDAVAELNRTEAFANGLRMENEALRNGTGLLPETGAAVYGVKKIVLGRATAGIDEDKVAGDEGLRVWLEPKDGDDHTIKAPGVLQVCVFEISAQGLKSPLSTWDVGPDQLRKSWTQGLLSTAYSVQLYWKVPPRVETLRVVARFTTPDGRPFEAERDIKVRLLPGAASRPESSGSCPVEFGPLLPPNLRPIPQAAPAAPTPTTPIEQAVHIGRPTVADPRPTFELIDPIHPLPTADELRSIE